MKLTERFGDRNRVEIECHPSDGETTIYIETLSEELDTRNLGRLHGFLGLCLEAIRRMEELKEQQDG